MVFVENPTFFLLIALVLYLDRLVKNVKFIRPNILSKNKVFKSFPLKTRINRIEAFLDLGVCPQVIHRQSFGEFLEVFW